MSDALTNGLTAVPNNPSKLFDGKPYRTVSEPLSTADIIWPSDNRLVAEMQAYAKQRLFADIYNHSMRVYYFSFPKFATMLSPATLALACLPHDLGATKANMTATNNSFEFYSGIKAMHVLETAGASTDQAAAVCECSIRHQDLGVDGNIAFLGQLVQLAAVYDNVNEHSHLAGLDALIHEEAREAVLALFPRLGWLGCFARRPATETTR